MSTTWVRDMVRPVTEEIVNVSSVAHKGAGVGRLEVAEGQEAGPTWFVEGALPGERVAAVADQRARRFIRGRAVRILEPAAERVEPPCSLAHTCGGCSWQHVDVSAQGELKRRIVADQLRAVVPNESVTLHESAPGALAYRRRARVHYERDDHGAVTMGFHAARSREIVDVKSCPVLVPALDEALARLREHPGLLLSSGQIHGLTDGTLAAVALPGVRPENRTVELARAALGGSLVGIMLRGGRRTQSVGRTRLSIDSMDGLPPITATPLSFQQANAERNRELVVHVTRRASPAGMRVLELFCGAGNFTRALATSAQRIWALDDDRTAISSLRDLAQHHRMSVNAKHSAVTPALARMVERGESYDVVVLDPPRTGLGEKESAQVARIGGSRIVYVSCDPATLARDLKVFVEKGWVVGDVTVFDLMPMTPAVETVVTLIRRGPRPEDR